MEDSITPPFGLKTQEDILSYKRAVQAHYVEHYPDYLERLRNEIRIEVWVTLLRARLHYGLPLYSFRGVFFVDLGHTHAAQTLFFPTEKEYSIEIDETFFLMNIEEFRRFSIGHEIAHIVAYHREQCLSHECASFREAMQFLCGGVDTEFSIPSF